VLARTDRGARQGVQELISVAIEQSRPTGAAKEEVKVEKKKSGAIYKRCNKGGQEHHRFFCVLSCVRSMNQVFPLE